MTEDEQELADIEELFGKLSKSAPKKMISDAVEILLARYGDMKVDTIYIPKIKAPYPKLPWPDEE